MYTRPRIACARAAASSGRRPLAGCARPRWIRMAALSVSAEPSGSTRVGIWHSGLMRASSSCPGPGSHDAASMHVNSAAASVSAASAAAEPDPLVPNSVYMCPPGSLAAGRVRQCLEAAVHFLGWNILDVRGERPHVAEWIDERAGAIAVELV